MTCVMCVYMMSLHNDDCCLRWTVANSENQILNFNIFVLMCNLWGFACIQFRFSISTGLNAPDRLVQPCTVHHKYIILSYKINHPSGIKLDFKREIYHRVTLSWLKRTWLLEANWHEPIIPLVVPANWSPLHECKPHQKVYCSNVLSNLIGKCAEYLSNKGIE